jgi:hypothetical protein
MGATKCIALTLEEECDDLVDAAGRGLSLERDGGLIILAS